MRRLLTEKDLMMIPKRTIPKLKIGAVILLLAVTLWFVWVIHDDQSYCVYSGSAGHTAMLDISGGETITQTFLLEGNNFRSIQLYLRKEGNFGGAVILELLDADSQVKTRMSIEADGIPDGDGGYCEAVLPEEIDALGSVYAFRLYIDGGESDGAVTVGTDDSGTYTNGACSSDGQDVSFVLDFKINYVVLRTVWLAIALCLVFLAVLCVCVLVPEGGRAAGTVSLLVYCLVFLFAIFRMAYYENFVGRTPDEIAHISYIAWLERTDALIPDFMEMTSGEVSPDVSLRDDVWEVRWAEDDVNYLGHPPLYYQIMRLASAFTFEGDYYVVNVAHLRHFSMAIAALAVALIFYIGYSRLDRGRPCIHLLYAMITTSVPMMLYGAGGISNDTLALLTVTVYLLGILRFTEKKRDWKTYLLIALGVTCTLLTKTTAGLMTVIASVLVIAICLWREKSWKELFQKAFYVTLPVYLPAVLYFVYIYRVYGTFQPSLADFVSQEVYRQTVFYVQQEDRVAMTLPEYIRYYWEEFLNTWTGIASHVACYKFGELLSTDRIALVSLWFVPAVYFIFAVRKKRRDAVPCLCLYAGVIVTALLQLANGVKGFYSRGYLGGFQSRYYICAITVFGLAIAALFQNLLPVEPLAAPESAQSDGEIWGAATCRIAGRRCRGLRPGFIGQIWDREGKSRERRPGRQAVGVLLYAVLLLYIMLLFYEDFIWFLLNFFQYLT